MLAPDISALPSRYFQPALSAAPLSDSGSALLADRLGEVVTDEADVDQCIRTILTTPKGADPHRPLFGSNLHLYIDSPVSTARPYIVREVVAALQAWEPRIEVVRVQVLLTDVAQLTCSVAWRFSAAARAEVVVTNLALGVA